MSFCKVHRILYAIIIFHIGLHSNKAQTGFSRDSLAILDVFEKQQEAWNNQDIESFMQGYWQSNDLVFIGASGPTYGFGPVKANYYQRYPDKLSMGMLKFGVIQLSKIDRTTAFLIGKFHLTAYHWRCRRVFFASLEKTR